MTGPDDSVKHVDVGRANGVFTLALNRPEVRNALNTRARIELAHAIKAAAVDDDIRVVVVTGKGGAFSSGGDIGEMGTGRTPIESRNRMRAMLETVIAPLWRLEKPTIAAVDGFAYGAGLSLALACDLIIAGESARFSMAFVKVGLVPDCGSLFFLPRVVGINRAKDLVFTGRALSAHEAAEIGLVNRVVPDGELQESVNDFAHELAGGAPVALGLMKTILNRSLSTAFDEFLELESLAVAIASSTDDHLEGISAFRAKRPPTFRGH